MIISYVEGKWVVIKSSPLSRSQLLRGLLERQFPDLEFNYLRFSKNYFAAPGKLSREMRRECLGVIAELKQLKASKLHYFDHLVRQFKLKSIIFILSPESFNLLSKYRKKTLFKHMIIISELKSLDYLTQLPRLMGELSLRQKLKIENERLRRLIETEAIPADLPFDSLFENKDDQPSQKGLKITLKSWTRMRGRLGSTAGHEVVEAFSRMISRAVRSSDRILHNKDNEFVVFLSNIDSKQHRKCMQRVKEKLSSIELQANARSIDLNFSIQSIDQLPYMT